MGRKLSSQVDIGWVGLRGLVEAVERRTPRTVYRWVARFWSLIVLILIVALFGGPISDGSLDAETLLRADVIHRQAAAVVSLEEKGFMLRIIRELGTGLTADQYARLAPMLVDQGRRLELDPLLLVALIMTESSFGPTQVSEMGAMGLMQVKPSVAEGIATRAGWRLLCADQLFDPAINVRLGTRYLFELLLEFGDVRKALIAYNCGETAMRRRLDCGLGLPTGYFQRVRNSYYLLREKFGQAAPWQPVRFDLPIN